jgi:hypothetical protein
MRSRKRPALSWCGRTPAVLDDGSGHRRRSRGGCRPTPTTSTPELTEADLPNLNQRLKPAEGWQFKAKTLDRNLILDTKGLAHIVADDLEDMYQGCTEDVRNFDP